MLLEFSVVVKDQESQSILLCTISTKQETAVIAQ